MTGTIQRLRDAGVIAVLRAPDRDSALRGVEALLAGGVTGIEITYSTPDAAAVIATVAGRYGEEAVLGAGTVLTAAQAREAADAGASFLVSPGTGADVAAAMHSTGLTCLLGALTPSEVMAASALGAHLVKLFPGSLGGPAYLRSLRGPFPGIPFVPTGGVSPGNVGEWRRAGAVAVGAGSELCSAADLAGQRWADISGKAKAIAASWAEAGQ